MTDLFGGFDGKGARDEALKRVTTRGGDWQERAIASLPVISGFKGTAEDIRIRLIMKGLDSPHHWNAWGAMIQEAIKRRAIWPTGERRHMRTTKSHARMTPVYVVA